MQRQKKIWTIIMIILAGYICFGIFSWIVRKNGMVYPHGSFLFFPVDQYMDFFNVNQMVTGLRPYVDYYSTYPPLILAIAYLFSLMADYKTYIPYEIVYTTEGKISFILFIGMFTAIIFVFLCIIFLREKELFKHKILIPPVVWILIFTAPYVWMLDRGNYLLVAIVCYLFFAYYYDKNDTAAAIFLGLAAAIKIYPLLIFFIFFLDKKWKPLLIACGTVFITSALTLIMFKGGYIQNIKEIICALFAFGGGYTNEVPNVYFSVGLSSILRLPFVLWNNLIVPENVHVMRIYFVVGSALALWTLWNVWREKLAWKRVMAMTALMVFLIPNSYDYNLTFLFPAIVLFLIADKSEKKSVDIIYLVLNGLLMIPKAYYYMLAPHGIGIQIVINAALLLGMILYYNIGDNSTRVKRKLLKTNS
ncbi:MAG: DUF2029 domain-containing protein [Lachnospiraceae bacterium]|nr:DUF2029 domain-containing protein [Lachnospiraceae bacterium]